MQPSHNLPMDSTESEFKAFLQRIATGDVAVEDWNRYAVTHYADVRLERMRQRLVRGSLMIGQCSARVVRQDLAELARELINDFE